MADWITAGVWQVTGWILTAFIVLQEQGGATWSYSQHEIEEMLQSKQPLPPELQQLMDAR